MLSRPTVKHQLGPERRASPGTRQTLVRAVRSDFLYEVQGGARPSELAEHRRPAHRRASSRRPCEVLADGRTQARAGLNLVPPGASCGREPLHVAQQVVAYDRPAAGSQAQGRPGGRPFTCVVQAHRGRWPAPPPAGSEAPGRPSQADPSRPGPRAARLGDAPARPHAASPLGPDPVERSRPCAASAGCRWFAAAPWHQDEGGVLG